MIILVRLVNIIFFLDGCVYALLLAVEEAFVLLLAFALLRGVTVSSTPVAYLVRRFFLISGSFIIRATGPVVALGLCLGLEAVVVVLFTVRAVVGRVAIFAAFAADSFVLLLCPNCKGFLS